MNRITRYENQGRHRPSTVVRETVGCSLSKDPSGEHYITIAASREGVISHVSCDCSIENLTADAIKRLGGECCAGVLAEIMEYVTGKDNASAPNLNGAGFLTMAMGTAGDHAKLVRVQRKGGRLAKAKAFKNVVTSPKRRNRRVTKLVQDASGLDCVRVELDYTEASDEIPAYGEWSLLFRVSKGSHSQWKAIGTRKWGKFGWSFDEQRTEALIRGNQAIFIERPGVRALIDSDNHWCPACRDDFKSKRGHCRTSGHVERTLQLLRHAMMAWPGPRR